MLVFVMGGGLYCGFLIINIICSRIYINIIVLTAYIDYLIVGDLSGRVSIFDKKTYSLIKTFSVNGAVSKIRVAGDRMAIDSIEAKHFNSPSSLSEYSHAVRTYMSF